LSEKEKAGLKTTQSVKKLKKHLKEWALATDGGHLEGISGTFEPL
jgi:hypothetical protein